MRVTLSLRCPLPSGLTLPWRSRVQLGLRANLLTKGPSAPRLHIAPVISAFVGTCPVLSE